MKPSKQQQQYYQKKKEQAQKEDINKQLILGVAIAVVVMAVVALKIAGQQADATPLELAPTSAAAPTQLAPSPTNAQALGPALPAPTLTQDPSVMPSGPAAQVEWAIKNHKPAMILYHSTTCIPCKAMEQLVAKVRGDYEPGVVFIDVITNDRANLSLIQQSKIQAIPTTFFLTSSGQAKRVVGAMKEEALRTELTNLKAGQ